MTFEGLYKVSLSAALLLFGVVSVQGQTQRSFRPYSSVSVLADASMGLNVGLMINHRNGNFGLRVGPTTTLHSTREAWLIGSEFVVHIKDSLRKPNMFLYRETGLQFSGFVRSSTDETRSLNYIVGSGPTFRYKNHSQTFVFNAIFRFPLDGQAVELENVFIGGLKILITFN